MDCLHDDGVLNEKNQQQDLISLIPLTYNLAGKGKQTNNLSKVGKRDRHVIFLPILHNITPLLSLLLHLAYIMS